jgi:membrane peptidoglycan carboxypeptidase
MAAAYATFAADGKYCEPMVVSRIQDRNGKDLPGLGPKCKPVMTVDQARTVAAILQGVTRQPGTGWRIPAIFGRPVAGKTGTAQNSGGAWFVGFTPQYATAVGMGDPRGGQARPLRGHRDPVTRKWVTVRIKGQVYPSVDGGKVPAPTFARIMRNIHQGLPVRGFAPPGS